MELRFARTGSTAVAAKIKLESLFGQRPLIFYSNGWGHRSWGDTRYPPRLVRSLKEEAGLEPAILRRSRRGSVADGEINSAMIKRSYQSLGIWPIVEAFEHGHDLKAIAVMNTGAGKTCDGQRRYGAHSIRLRQSI